MRILRVIASMDPATGGLAQAVRNSVAVLQGHGIETEVACGDPEGTGWFGTDPFPVHALGPGRFGFAYSPRWLPWLTKNLSRFDAVIVDGLWLYPGLAVGKALSRLHAGSCPSLFVMPHGMLDPYFQKAPERRLKALRNTFYWHLAERHLVNRANALFFTCEKELLLARTTFRGYQPRREINVGLGIEEPPPASDSQTDAIASLCPGPAGRRSLLFLSRIHAKKGVDLLVDAWAQAAPSHPHHLVIAGPGWDTTFGESVKAHIREQGLADSITCLGMLQGDAKWGAFLAADAFILPSHQENFGIAVVEALACNKPVYITNKVNIWREILASHGGHVAADSPDGIRQLLESWLGTPHGSFGDDPRKTFESHFTAKVANRRLAEAIRNNI